MILQRVRVFSCHNPPQTASALLQIWHLVTTSSLSTGNLVSSAQIPQTSFRPSPPAPGFIAFSSSLCCPAGEAVSNKTPRFCLVASHPETRTECDSVFTHEKKKRYGLYDCFPRFCLCSFIRLPNLYLLSFSWHLIQVNPPRKSCRNGPSQLHAPNTLRY